MAARRRALGLSGPALMAVYVDDVRHKFGHMVMCHMWADSEAELLAMVDLIKVRRRWVQRPPNTSWLHVDIAMDKKAKAIAAGAILTDRYGPSEHTARLDVASGEPCRVARGEEMIAAIARARAMRSAKE